MSKNAYRYILDHHSNNNSDDVFCIYSVIPRMAIRAMRVFTRDWWVYMVLISNPFVRIYTFWSMLTPYSVIPRAMRDFTRDWWVYMVLISNPFVRIYTV